MNSPVAAGRVRLWVLLAALAVVGVSAMHAVHLILGTRISAGALSEGQAVLGQQLARVLADRAADLVLVDDLLALHELVDGAARADGGMAYCFVAKEGRILASSFTASPPSGLLQLRAPGDYDPVVIRSGGRSVLDLAQPILGGELGMVRVGLDLSLLQTTRRRLAVQLGLIALVLILGGIGTALWAGWYIARPATEMLAAVDRFDPAAFGPVPEVRTWGTRELAVLGERFNKMMARLKAASVEQARAKEKAIATERMVALGSLVAGVAHEVNNPLTGMRNCLRRLERPDLSLAKREEYLELMEDGLGRIEEVVRRLLDFGRPRPLALVPVEAGRMAADAARFVGPILARREVSVQVLAPPEGATLLADRRLVGQALVNLLLNAFHVTPAGGTIRLRVVREERRVGIAVEDDGPGIPPEIRERIFDPYFSTKPEGEGTGLGLTVTCSILEVHGGELTLQCPQEGGTIATVWLPVPVELPSLATA